MGRNSEIDRHPKKEAIIRALIKQTPYRSIAKRYGVTISALHRYLNGKLLVLAAKEKEKREKKDGRYILAEIDRLMEKMNKMFDACDEFLRDPDDPGKYWLGPRAHEVEVLYCEVDEEGKRGPAKKEKLHILLKRLEGNKDMSILDYETKIADARILILRTSEVLGKHLKLISEVQGLIKHNITINNIQNWTEMKAIILSATSEFPEIRNKLVSGLKKFIEKYGGDEEEETEE